MEYLSSKNCIHRDLAARNCMLDENYIVNVSDFGLSRDIHEREYYRMSNIRPLPIKWMPPESIENCFFNVKTDVWSYGVLLWELMTRGEVPFRGLSADELIVKLRSGQRLAQPQYCPNSVYKIL